MNRGRHAASFTRRTLLRGAAATAVAAVAGPGLLPRVTPPALGAVAAGLPHAPADAPVKSAATFYTPDRVDAARHNVATYGWAAQLRDDAVAAAQPYVDAGDKWLWQQVTTQGLPRSYAVNQDLGSPVTGRDIYAYGNYPWIIDHLARPWKMVDPSVPEGSSEPRVYPTNDFAAFYRSGLNERGEFDRARADESLLVNELYPERGPSWGVDDGFGWVDGNGDKWTFVPYYNHWGLWVAGGGQDFHGFLARGIVALRDAYLYTGDPSYARAGVILLDRLADLYPSMDTEPYKREDGYFHSDGLSGNGRVVGCIWETGLIRNYVYAYDAFFPAIAESDTLDVVPFLSAQAAAHGLPPKDSVDDIRLNIENGILREVSKGVQDAKIYGNFGMHQHTLAAAAVVLDDRDASPAWIDFVFATGGRVRDPEYRVTGGAFYQTLVDLVDRDGAGNEGSPGYNDLWIGHVKGVADVLDGYAGYPEANLYEHPKYAKMFQTRHTLPMVGRYLPAIGDTGQTGKSQLRGTPSDHVAAFERFGSPEYAQLAHLLGEGDLANLYSDVFALDVEGTQQRITEIIDRQGPLLLPSENLAGFGLAALRAAEVEQQRAAWIYYGRTRGHGHRDTLNLGLYAFELDLLPDLGYPEFADNNARRLEWTSNTIAHNTVVVDATPQAVQWVAQPQGFGATDRVQFADIAAPDVYPQASLYRRAVAQIRVDEENSYVVDVFRVRGGDEHHFSFHAAEGDVTAVGLDLVAQEGGSYAGPDVEPPPADAPPRSGASGFDWLSNVERDTSPPGAFALDWSVVDTYGVHEADPDVHLRLHAFHHADDVALADGIPPRNKPGNPDSLRYLVSHRRGTDLASQFVSVVEPYRAQPFIRSVTEVGVEGRSGDLAPHEVAALRVELSDGRVDYVVSSVRTDVQIRVDGAFNFRGSFGVYSLRDGRPEYAFGHNTTMVGPAPQMAGPPAVTGTLQDFTRELSAENRFTVELAEEGPKPDRLAGGYVYVLGTDPTWARIVYPWRTPSTAGDYGALNQQITVHDAASHQLSVQVHDDFTGATAGYHFIQVLIDGEVVAEDDVAGGAGWRELAADVTENLAGKATATLTLRLFDKRGVSNFGVTALFDDVAISGTTIQNADFQDTASAAWQTESTSPSFLVDPSFSGEGGAARNAVYPIAAATATDKTNTTLLLEIGDVTTVRGYVDPNDFEAGYTHNVAAGATVIIPITREWSAS